MAITGRKKKSISKLAKSTRLGRQHARVMKKTKPGTGKRFASMVGVLKKKGARSPKALAAWIGRRKYGAKKMGAMAAKGKARKR